MSHRLLNIFAALLISIILWLLLWLLIPNDFFNEFHLRKIEEQNLKANEQLEYYYSDNSGILKQLKITEKELADEILIKSKDLLEIALYLDSNERLISQTIYAADINNNKLKELYYLSSIKDSAYLNILEYTKDKLDIITKVKKALEPIKYFNKVADVQNFGMQLTDDDKIVFNLQSGFKLQPRNFYIYDIKSKKIIKTSRNSIVHKAFKVINYRKKHYILPTNIIASGNTFSYKEIDSIIKITKSDPDEIHKKYNPYSYSYGDYSSYIMLYNENLEFEFEPIEFYGWTNFVVSDYIITNDSLYIISLTGSKRDSNFTRELIVTNIKGEIVRKIENIKYSEIFCNSVSGQIVLISKAYIEVFDSQFNLLKKIKTSPIEYIYGFKDLDIDGKDEFILHTNNELIIYSQDFSSKIKVPISTCSSERVYRKFSTFNSNNRILTQIQIGDKFVVFEYSKNFYSSFKYPFALLLFAFSYLFTWFVLKINRRRLEALNIKLEETVKDRTLEIQKQAEELIETNKKLVKLDEFKENMTGMIVHDLKNPLNTIINISTYENPISQIPYIKQSGKQMLNMVMNILDVHKYEYSKMKLDISNIELSELIDESINEIHFLANQKNITIIKKTQKAIVVIADGEIIKRVFVNILTNAIKYTRNNGEITIDVEPYNSQLSDNGFIKINITDTGIGIPKEKLHLVFEKFGQVQSEKSGSVRSTGLGLAFCKMAIEAHGTEINVNSELGNGTNFWFTLPLANVISKHEKVSNKILTIENGLKLSAQEKEYLKPYLKQMEEIMVYEVSRVKSVLNQIDSKNSKAIIYWKQQVSNAAFTMNKEMYSNLISEASKNE
jgi:signal transduction histidine kinase